MKIFSKHFKNKDNLFLIAVLVFAFLLRVILLDRFPIGMTHDELNHIVTAKSLFFEHTFVPGTGPAVLPTNMSYSTVTIPEVSSIILATLIGGLPLSLFTSRIVGALFSVLSIWAIYYIALHITKKRLFAQITILLMAINPWSFLLGRTMAELNFFVAFFLLGFLVLLKSKGWGIMRALPFYLLGFFSYTGGQISFLAFMITTPIYHYFISTKNKKNLKIYAIFIGIVSLIFAGYVFVTLQNQTFKSRGAELYLPNQPEIADTVNESRKLSIQTPFNNLFINKATVYANGFISKYINTFSVDFLFLKGEARAIFSYQTHGTFYLIDLIFIVIGLSSLFVINRKGWILFLAIIAGCSVTSGLSVVESSYSQRVGLIYPFLIMLSGIGIATIITEVKQKKLRIILSIAITLLYLISLANLMHIYFIRFPIYASDGWFFQDRVLTSYIKKVSMANTETKVVVYSVEPKIIFEEYLFYTNTYDKNNIKLINKQLDIKDYSIGNITFTDKCPEANPNKDTITIFEGSMGCYTLSSLTDMVRISRLKDVHANYHIYNDQLCNNFKLNSYIPLSAYNDFSVEKQSLNQFCLNWVTKIEE
jgi:hypothetical protein